RDLRTARLWTRAVRAIPTCCKAVALSLVIAVKRVRYGPERLTALAYRQSVEPQPITSPWFARYLVPQIEITMPADSPSEVGTSVNRMDYESIDSGARRLAAEMGGQASG